MRMRAARRNAVDVLHLRGEVEGKKNTLDTFDGKTLSEHLARGVEDAAQRAVLWQGKYAGLGAQGRASRLKGSGGRAAGGGGAALGGGGLLCFAEGPLARLGHVEVLLLGVIVF